MFDHNQYFAYDISTEFLNSLKILEKKNIGDDYCSHTVHIISVQKIQTNTNYTPVHNYKCTKDTSK